MRRVVLAALIVLAPVSILLADVIHTTEGKKLKGEIIKETDEYVVLKGKYGERKVYRDEIDHIERGPVEEGQKPKKARKKKKKMSRKAPPKEDIESLVEKAANGDASAARKLKAAKRAALIPLAGKIEQLEGAKKERLERLRDEIEENTQAEKEQAEKHRQNAIKILKKHNALQDKAGKRPSQQQRQKLLDLKKAAGEELENAFELDPTREDILKAIAVMYYRSRLYASAVPHLKLLLSRKPGDPDFEGMLVTCHLRLKKYKEAEKLLMGILKKKPDDKIAWANLGKVHHEQRKYDEAIRDLEKAVSLGLRDAPTYNYLGMAYREKKKWDKAIENFEKCLEKDPKHPNALWQLGVLYANKEEYQKAVEKWEKFCKLYPDSREAKSVKQELKKLKKKAGKKK